MQYSSETMVLGKFDVLFEGEYGFDQGNLEGRRRRRDAVN